MRTRWRRYGLALGGVMLATWVSLVATLLLTFHPVASDWNVYYDTARALRASPHADLWSYATTASGGAQPGGCSLWPNNTYLYPPLFAILIVPLTQLPCSGATLVWRVVTLALWGACALALAAPPWRAGGRRWALAVIPLVAFYLPLIDGMLLGQVHLVILALILAGVALAASGRQVWGGGALAVGAWIKYAPGVIAAYYLLTGRWRVAVGATVVGAALLLAQVWVVGPAALAQSFTLIEVAATGAIKTGAVWYGWPGGSLWGLAAGAIFALGVVGARWRGTAKGDDRLGIGWALCTMLVASPVIQWFYLTWLLPAFWACLLVTIPGAQRDGGPGVWRSWAPLTALALIFVVSLVPFNHITISAAIVALWLLCGALYLRSAGVRVRVPIRLKGLLARLAPRTSSSINDHS